jgi:hypothetical protein
MKTPLKAFLAVSILSAAILPSVAVAGTRSERREAAVSASAAVPVLTGGVEIEVPLAFDAAFPAAVEALKRLDYMPEIADPVVGRIATGLAVTGKGKQTGTRVILVFLKGPTATTLRVQVSRQTRYNVLQVEPWSDAQLDAKAATDVATKLRGILLPKS